MRILKVGRGLLVLGASALALAGLAQLVLGWLPALGSEAPPRSSAVASDGVAARVRDARWVALDHSAMGAGPGFQMPASMMPGAPPEGQVRLAVSVTLTNTGTVGRSVGPHDAFTLRDASTDDSWQLRADTFAGLSRLSSLSAADGVLFFDVPEEAADEQRLYVSWKHAGQSVRLAVKPGSETGTHSHH